MAQIISIKMSKFDNQPWGFRLQGGTDFAAPLTVLRVHGDSLAEKAGLRVGDALIRVNDTDIYQLRHKEAQDVIVRAGNNFELVISRGGGMPKTVVRPNDIQVVGPTIAPAPPVPAPAPAPAPTPVATEKADGGNVKLVNRQFNSPMPLYSEENIAETLSSQAEVLAQGVLGVNFKKNEKTFNPANSEVFKMVQDMDRAPREPEPGIDIDPADASPAQKGLASRTIQSRTFQRIQQQTNNQSLDAALHHQHQPQHQQQITISTKPILSPTSVQQGPPTPAERAPHFAPLAAPHLKPQSPGAFPGKTFLGHHPMTAPMPAAVPPPPGGVRIFPPAPVAKSISQVGHQVKSTPLASAPVKPVSFAPAAPRPAGFLTGIPAASAAPPAGGKGNGGATNSGPRRGKGIMNHHVAGTRIPVCATCNAQIRGKFVTALGLTWCPEHFLCSMEQCRHELHDTGFVEEQGKLYCETCFENHLAPTCARCSKRVKAECLNAIGKQFHPECFACTYCGRLFGNSHFYLEDGLPYCEADWNELFTTKCFACGFPIEAGDRWVEAMNNNYHSQCFNCSVCKKNLEGQSFLGKGGRPMCKSHVR